jgi:hypothetical protein
LEDLDAVDAPAPLEGCFCSCAGRCSGKLARNDSYLVESFTWDLEILQESIDDDLALVRICNMWNQEFAAAQMYQWGEIHLLKGLSERLKWRLLGYLYFLGKAFQSHKH